MAKAAGRIDSASRIIRASPHVLYRTLIDPEALVSWRPPEGMTGEMLAFDGREGGRYRMSLTYTGAGHEVRGKTSEHADVVEGRFLELVPDRRVVEVVEFDSDDPAFAGAMTITTALAVVPGGTEVTIRCENVPDGIRPDDHLEGLASTLANLAAFTE
jgi:uncharacterized protein YndB with AHSA1/START domain